MGLSDRKSKQKISEDPRNTKWASNLENKGHKLLMSMGWNPGSKTLKDADPLPAKIFSRIPTAKDDNLGIGASKLMPSTGSIFSTMGTRGLKFVSGGDVEQQRHLATEGADFSSLLARLNKAKEEVNASDAGKDALNSSKTANARNASRAKYLKSKRLAATSNADDLVGILGFSSPFPSSSGLSTPVTPLEPKSPETHAPVISSETIIDYESQTAVPQVSTAKSSKKKRKHLEGEQNLSSKEPKKKRKSKSVE